VIVSHQKASVTFLLLKQLVFETKYIAIFFCVINQVALLPLPLADEAAPEKSHVRGSGCLYHSEHGGADVGTSASGGY